MLSPALEELFEQGFEPLHERDFPQKFRLYSSDGVTPLPIEDVPLTRARQGEIVTDAVVSTRRKDGRMAFLRCNAAPIKASDGEILGAVVLVRDITAERAAQHEQDELRDRLVVTINHEFRTPLTKLLGHAELLADSDEMLPEQTKRSIQTMFQATQDLVRLLESLTQLIDLDSHTRLHRRYGDVADLLREIASDFTHLARIEPHRVTTEVPDRLTATLDPQETRKAIWELLKNALTYGPDDSVIVLSGKGNSATVWISVCDAGCGIPAEARARLMHPFERGTHANQPINSKGLGLAIAHTVARAHGGQLELADREPHGLRATLVMPRLGGHT
jgi:signal transduction histidine kinase